MKLERRERILAVVALGLVGLGGVWFLFLSGDGRTREQLAARKADLTDEIKTKQVRLAAANAEKDRLAKMRQRALPSDTVQARTLYQDWLRRLATRAEFHEIKLTGYEGVVRREQATRVSATLACRATLGGLVQFLYEFYSAGFLQQIRRLDVKFVRDSTELDVNFSIEAFSLSAAESKDQLPKESGLAQKYGKLADYRDALNLFSAPAPPDAPPAKNDEAANAAVTGFTEVGGAWQVWIEDRGASKRWKWAAGEHVAVGSVKGVVRSIGPEEVFLDVGGRRRVLRLGDKLTGGAEAPDQRPAAPRGPGGPKRP